MNQTVRLGEVAQIVSGQSPPGTTYNERGVGLPFFQGKAEFGQVNPVAKKWCTAPVKTADVGDILISVRAPVGPTNVADQRCCIGRGLAAIRPDHSKADRDYIHWAIRWAEPRLVQKGQGSTFSAINRKDLQSLELPLPPLSEQRRIVDILNRANGIRRLRREAQKKARQIIPALFVEMFGDPQRNPKGWPVGRLVELVSFVSGATPSKQEPRFWGGDVAWVSAKDMKAPLISSSTDRITAEALADTNIKLIPVDSILVVVRGLILAHTVPIAVSKAPLTINQDLKALLPTSSLQTEYLRWAMQMMHGYLLSQVSTAAHGTKKLDLDRLKSLAIPLPSISLQQAFAFRVADIQAMIAQQDRMATTSERLVNSLMAEVFES